MEMIGQRAVGGRERRGKRAVRRGYDQVKSVMFVVGRNINMLSKVEGGEKRETKR